MSDDQKTGAAATAAASPGPQPAQNRTVAEQLKDAHGLLKAAGLLLAALPPLAVITGVVDIPPTLGQLVKLVTVPISIVAVFLVFILGESIARMSAFKAVLLFGGLVVAGAVASVSYYSFADSHIVAPDQGPIVVPVRPSRDIAAIVGPYDGDYEEALENSPDNERLAALMMEESGSSVMLMIALMVFAQVLMVAGMVGALWKIVVSQDAARRALAAVGSPPSAGTAPPSRA